jgi:hypothetical protein
MGRLYFLTLVICPFSQPSSKSFCKYLPNSVDRKPYTSVFMLSSSHYDFIIGTFKFPRHSASNAFPIHYLKYDWVEGSNSCLEFLWMLSTQLWSSTWAFSWRYYRYECCVPQREHGTRRWGLVCTSWDKEVDTIKELMSYPKCRSVKVIITR